MNERVLLAVGWVCLGGVLVPLGLMSLLGMASPSAESLIPLSGFSVGSALLGLLVCAIAFRRNRSSPPIVLGLLLLIPATLSTVLLVDGMREAAYWDDVVFCATAEREKRTVRRGEAGYQRGLDQDGDGYACEPILGPSCYQGRCVPFG